MAPRALPVLPLRQVDLLTTIMVLPITALPIMVLVHTTMDVTPSVAPAHFDAGDVVAVDHEDIMDTMDLPGLHHHPVVRSTSDH